jgi:hypothetical protein
MAMALITLSSIMLAVFLWWQSTWYLQDGYAIGNQTTSEIKTQQN